LKVGAGPAAAILEARPDRGKYGQYVQVQIDRWIGPERTHGDR
jgi:hypothetical protein